jgi:hypothetical protein
MNEEEELLEQIWKKLLEIADRVLVLEKKLLEARDGGDE